MVSLAGWASGSAQEWECRPTNKVGLIFQRLARLKHMVEPSMCRHGPTVRPLTRFPMSTSPSQRHRYWSCHVCILAVRDDIASLLPNAASSRLVPSFSNHSFSSLSSLPRPLFINQIALHSQRNSIRSGNIILITIAFDPDDDLINSAREG